MNDKEILEEKKWEPRIVAFFCTWCTYTAADLAGVSRLRHAPNARIIRVMCSGRIEPTFILKAFQQGADGVQRIEPATRLVHSLANEIGRVLLAELLLIFERVMPLGHGHGA